MSVLSSWMDKNVPSWRGNVQNVTDWGKERLGFGGDKFRSGDLASMGKFLTQGVEGTNPFAANLGLLGMLGSGAMMAPKYSFSQSTFDRLSGQLDPLRDSIKRTGEMAQGYMDPNSTMNQQYRDSIRGDELSHLQDVIERNQNRSTGTYGSSVGQQMNQNMMSDAVAQALGSYSSQLGQRQDKGINLLNQQSQLQNALSQGQMQASMAGMQAGKFMPQYLGQQFAGLLNYGMGGSSK